MGMTTRSQRVGLNPQLPDPPARRPSPIPEAANPAISPEYPNVEDLFLAEDDSHDEELLSRLNHLRLLQHHSPSSFVPRNSACWGHSAPTGPEWLLLPTFRNQQCGMLFCLPIDQAFIHLPMHPVRGSATTTRGRLHMADNLVRFETPPRNSQQTPLLNHRILLP